MIIVQYNIPTPKTDLFFAAYSFDEILNWTAAEMTAICPKYHINIYTNDNESEICIQQASELVKCIKSGHILLFEIPNSPYSYLPLLDIKVCERDDIEQIHTVGASCMPYGTLVQIKDYPGFEFLPDEYKIYVPQTIPSEQCEPSDAPAVHRESTAGRYTSRLDFPDQPGFENVIATEYAHRPGDVFISCRDDAHKLILLPKFVFDALYKKV